MFKRLWIRVARKIAGHYGLVVLAEAKDVTVFLEMVGYRVVVGRHLQDALQRARGLLDFVETQAHTLGMQYVARKAFKEEIDKLGIALVRAYREVPGQERQMAPATVHSAGETTTDAAMPDAATPTPTGPKLVVEP